MTDGKKQTRQTYYNIAAGVTISLMVAIILAGAGWVTKMQVTVNKADLALREGNRNTEMIREKTKILHRRISKNTDGIQSNKDELNDLGKDAARTDERSKNYNEFWQFYERMRK